MEDEENTAPDVQVPRSDQSWAHMMGLTVDGPSAILVSTYDKDGNMWIVNVLDGWRIHQVQVEAY